MQHIASLYGTKPRWGAGSFSPADEERMLLVFCTISAIPAPAKCSGISLQPGSCFPTAKLRAAHCRP